MNLFLIIMDGRILSERHEEAKERNDHKETNNFLSHSEDEMCSVTVCEGEIACSLHFTSLFFFPSLSTDRSSR
jgi:hypothetical protein